jgi:hypothetical protein
LTGEELIDRLDAVGEVGVGGAKVPLEDVVEMTGDLLPSIAIRP